MIIGIGIDIVDLDTFRNRLSKELIQEVFLPDEINYANSQAKSWENFAARFAAKEAAFKSLGSGLSDGLRWKDIEVIKNPSGSVFIELHGKAGKIAEKKGITASHLSMSHSRRSAVAVVVLEKYSDNPDADMNK